MSQTRENSYTATAANPCNRPVRAVSMASQPAALAAAEALSKARVAAVKPMLVKSSIRDSTLKDVVKSAVHQGALSCATYGELAHTVRLALVRATDAAAAWDVIVCRAPYVLLRTRVGSVATLSVPCLAVELQASAPPEPVPAPGLGPTDKVHPPPNGRFAVLVFKGLPLQIPVAGATPLTLPAPAPATTDAATAGSGEAASGPGGSTSSAVADSTAAETPQPSKPLSSDAPSDASLSEDPSNDGATPAVPPAPLTAAAPAPSSTAPGACIEEGHSLPAEPTRALLRTLGALRSGVGLHCDAEEPFGAALREHLTRLYGSTWQVVLTASPVHVQVDKGGRRLPRPTPATVLRRPGFAVNAAPLHTVHVSLPSHFPEDALTPAADDAARANTEAARRRTPARYAVFAYRLPVAPEAASAEAPHPLDVVGSFRAWWRAQGVSVDAWEAGRIGLYCLGGAAALAYVAATYGYDNSCAAAAGPQAALEGMLAAAGSGFSGGTSSSPSSGSPAVPSLGGGGGSAHWSLTDSDAALAWAAAGGAALLRRFASGLARMPVVGDALWAVGITAGGADDWGAVRLPPLQPSSEGAFAAGGAGLPAFAAEAEFGSGSATGADPLGELATRCSPAETAAAAHRLAWSSALLYALLGCFAAVSLLRVMRKHSEKGRVRAIIRAMQKEGRGGAAPPGAPNTTSPASGAGARQRRTGGRA